MSSRACLYAFGVGCRASVGAKCEVKRLGPHIAAFCMVAGVLSLVRTGRQRAMGSHIMSRSSSFAKFWELALAVIAAEP